jgi:hypothetical protein
MSAKKRPWIYCAWWKWKIMPTNCPPPYQAASSSAWPLPALWPMTRPLSSLTNRLATLTENS